MQHRITVAALVFLFAASVYLAFPLMPPRRHWELPAVKLAVQFPCARANGDKNQVRKELFSSPPTHAVARSLCRLLRRV
jgi:hypothetical protein